MYVLLYKHIQWHDLEMGLITSKFEWVISVNNKDIWNNCKGVWNYLWFVSDIVTVPATSAVCLPTFIGEWNTKFY